MFTLVLGSSACLLLIEFFLSPIFGQVLKEGVDWEKAAKEGTYGKTTPFLRGVSSIRWSPNTHDPGQGCLYFYTKTSGNTNICNEDVALLKTLYHWYLIPFLKLFS